MWRWKFTNIYFCCRKLLEADEFLEKIESTSDEHGIYQTKEDVEAMAVKKKEAAADDAGKTNYTVILFFTIPPHL